MTKRDLLIVGGITGILMEGVFGGGMARAQTATPPPTSAFVPNAALRDIQTAFGQAAARAKAAFIVEGEPFKRTLTETEASAIEQTGTPAEMVERIAIAYDYEATVQTKNDGATVYLLKKRYTDPADLPFVSLAELQIVCDEMHRLTAAFDPSPGASPLPSTEGMAAFGASLTDTQLAALMDKTRGLSLQSLTPQQRDQVQSGPIDIYLRQTVQYLQRGSEEARMAGDASAVIGRVGSKTQKAFGYEGPTLSDEGKRVRAYWWLGDSYSPIEARPVYKPIDGPEIKTAAAPLPPTAPSSPSVPPSPPLATTLQQSARQTQSRLAKSFPVVVDSEIAGKPVWLVNETAAAPDALLRGLGDLYRLRLTTKADGSHELSRMRPKARTIVELPDALLQSLPDDFTRAMRWQAIRREEAAWRAEINKRLETPNAPKMTPEEGQRLATPASAKIETRGRDVRSAAMKNLRSEIEPLLSRQTPTVPIASLSGFQQAALADLILGEVWAAVKIRVMNPTPAYILHLDDAVVTGGYRDFDSNEEKFGGRDLSGFALRFYYRDAAGGLKDTGFGVTVNLRAVSPK